MEATEVEPSVEIEETVLVEQVAIPAESVVAPVESGYIQEAAAPMEEAVHVVEYPEAVEVELGTSYPAAVEAVEAAAAYKASADVIQTAETVKTVKGAVTKAQGKTTADTWANPADKVMVFDSKSYDFGTINSGEKVEQLYTLTNLGEEALVIEVVSACDCIQLDYTRTLIEKGESGTISVVFDSNEQHGKIKKSIDIIFGNTDANDYPLIQQVELTGTVK